MSNKIIGSDSQLKKLKKIRDEFGIKKSGNVTLDIVDPNTINSYKNRQTKASTLYKYTKETGFDPRLCPPLIIAKMKNGSKYLLDGDHRLHLWKLYRGKNEPINAMIIEVGSKEEIHELFIKFNKDGRTDITPEEEFVHRYFSKIDDNALALADTLEKCGLKIDMNTGEPETWVGLEEAPTTRIRDFEKMINRSSELATIIASRVLQEVYPNQRNLPTQLHGGLAIVYDKSELANNTKTLRKFKDWLKDLPIMTKNQNKLLRNFKDEGARILGVSVPAEWSMSIIAIGIMSRFKESERVAPATWNNNFKEAYDSILQDLKK